MPHFIFFLIATAMGAAALTGSLLSSSEHFERRSELDVEYVVRQGLVSFQRGYQVLTEQAEGIPPAAQLEAQDGGLEAHFRPLLRLMPAAPQGYKWSYARQNAGAPAWADADYVCLSPSGSTVQGASHGAWSASHFFEPGRYVLNTYCGAAESLPLASLGEVYLTFYLAYEPPASVEGE